MRRLISKILNTPLQWWLYLVHGATIPQTEHYGFVYISVLAADDQSIVVAVNEMRRSCYKPDELAYMTMLEHHVIMTPSAVSELLQRLDQLYLNSVILTDSMDVLGGLPTRLADKAVLINRDTLSKPCMRKEYGHFASKLDMGLTHALGLRINAQQPHYPLVHICLKIPKSQEILNQLRLFGGSCYRLVDAHEKHYYDLTGIKADTRITPVGFTTAIALATPLVYWMDR